MADKYIFTSNDIKTESWSTQGCLMKWGTAKSTKDKGNIPLLINSVDIIYARTVTEVPMLNQTANGERRRIRQYGDPTGSLTIGSIFSPVPDKLKAFIDAVSKDCKDGENQVNVAITPFGGVTCTKDGVTDGRQMQSYGTFYLMGVDLQRLDVNIRVSSGQGLTTASIQVPLRFDFTYLKWDLEKTGELEQ